MYRMKKVFLPSHCHPCPLLHCCPYWCSHQRLPFMPWHRSLHTICPHAVPVCPHSMDPYRMCLHPRMPSPLPPPCHICAPSHWHRTMCHYGPPPSCAPMDTVLYTPTAHPCNLAPHTHTSLCCWVTPISGCIKDGQDMSYIS